MNRELQKNTDEQFSDIKKITQEQNEKFSKEVESIQKNQTEILELKNTMTKWRNSIRSFNSRLEQAGERIKELKDRSFKIFQSEEQKKIIE